ASSVSPRDSERVTRTRRGRSLMRSVGERQIRNNDVGICDNKNLVRASSVERNRSSGRIQLKRVRDHDGLGQADHSIAINPDRSTFRDSLNQRSLAAVGNYLLSKNLKLPK